MDPAARNAIANAEWIAGLEAGDGQVTAALRAHLRQGLAAALRQRPDVSDHDLDDFTQEAVLRVLERLETFRGDSRFTTWAMAVAVRVSLTALRRRRWGATPLGERLEPCEAPPSTGPHAVAARAWPELLGVLRTAIETELSPRQRQVLLAELDGVPQVVLADRLCSTPGAIYKMSHDARKRLKALLAHRGFDAETVMAIMEGSP